MLDPAQLFTSEMYVMEMRHPQCTLRQIRLRRTFDDLLLYVFDSRGRAIEQIT